MAEPLTETSGYKALDNHQKKMQNEHMREMFEANPKRFEDFR